MTKNQINRLKNERIKYLSGQVEKLEYQRHVLTEKLSIAIERLRMCAEGTHYPAEVLSHDTPMDKVKRTASHGLAAIGRV